MICDLKNSLCFIRSSSENPVPACVCEKKKIFNPLTANDELSRHENLTFLWTWILRWVPRRFATYASLCNTLSSNKP